jgi:hypothetical protein
LGITHPRNRRNNSRKLAVLVFILTIRLFD